MKAVYRNFPSGPPGHGLISLSGLEIPEAMVEVEFALKRASDHQILGVLGWQEAELRLRPLRLEASPEGHSLLVGPQVADHLDMREHYRLYLWLPDGQTARCSVTIESISYSPLAGGRAVEGGAPVAPRPAVETAGALECPEATPAAVGPNGPGQAGPADMSPPRAPFKRSKFRPVALALGLLIIVALGLWQLIPFGGGGPAPEAGPEPPEKPALALAREHLAGSADPERSLQMAAEYKKRPDGEDAAFLLIRDAARKDVPEAMLLLGEFYDPLAENMGSIIKDPLVARQWYESAQRAGVTEAADKLSALARWSSADSGDED